MKRPIDKLGRVSLPAEYRKELGIECGDYVEIEFKNGSIVVTNPASDNKKEQLIQAIQDGVDSETLVQMINDL